MFRGHNEIDDPTFTNPSMYRIINDRMSVPDLYAEKIVKEGHATKEHLADEISVYNDVLSNALAVTGEYKPKHVHFKGHWSSCQQAQNDVITNWNTGLTITAILLTMRRIAPVVQLLC